jgi:molecular chaperone GrpE
VDRRIEAAKGKLIQGVVTAVDELELALNAAKQTEGAQPVASGLEVVLKKLRDFLAAEGLAPIEAVGREFDPTLHEAVQRIPCDDAKEGMILEEVRKGYTLKGRLLRPSIVKIAVPQVAKPDEPSEGVSS